LLESSAHDSDAIKGIRQLVNTNVLTAIFDKHMRTNALFAEILKCSTVLEISDFIKTGITNDNFEKIIMTPAEGSNSPIVKTGKLTIDSATGLLKTSKRIFENLIKINSAKEIGSVPPPNALKKIVCVIMAAIYGIMNPQTPGTNNVMKPQSSVIHNKMTNMNMPIDTQTEPPPDAGYIEIRSEP